MNDYTLKSSIAQAIAFLFDEAGVANDPAEFVVNNDVWIQLLALRSLLCQRPATPALPEDITAAVEHILRHKQHQRVLVSSASIQPLYHVASSPVRISVWRGDITALRDVTAIVNAGNSALLGCFKPNHRCIDNVIHAAAGPRLREACKVLMDAQGHVEPNGRAKTTPGFCASAEWIIHTVGPQLRPGQQPSEQDVRDLAGCYASCLDAVQNLPPLADGRVVVIFPCISTGLFFFPAGLAAKIAVDAVAAWSKAHPATPLTDVIFDVFSAADEQHYRGALSVACASGTISFHQQDFTPRPSLSTEPCVALSVARQWLLSADYLVLSAGAGLSAATGLDYTSPELFRERFPAFLPLGLLRLYDVFGYTAWPTSGHKWGYYFTHLNMIQSWPTSPIYSALFAFANTRFGSNKFFVRTSNADGLFIANGFPAERVSTPQGAYKFLQCLRSGCKDTSRLDTVVFSKPFLEAALPHVDPETQVLADLSKIPRCARCGDELFLCVRGGAWFNELPYAKGEARYGEFLQHIETEGKSLVVLELGVGMNTPSVLRWHNEDLARLGGGRVKLIRAGLEAAGVMDFGLLDSGVAVGITGDVGDVLELLLK